MTMSRIPRFSALVLFAAFSLPVPAHADEDQSEFGPQAVPLEAIGYPLGSMRLLSLHDENLVLPNDGKIFGADVSPQEVAAVLHAHDLPDDRIQVSINVLYAENDKRHYLFDTGMAPAAKGNLLDNLAAHDIDPKAITDIFITHSHPDHVGGLLDAQGEPAFPNAKIHMAAREWAYMKTTDVNAAIAAKIAPQVVTFDKAGTVAPGVTAFPLPGHTPGHSGYRLTSKGQSIIDIGDLVHNWAVSLAKPDWAMGFDGDRDTGKATRRAELARLAHAHSLIFATHFPYPGIGTIAPEGNGYAWQAKE